MSYQNIVLAICAIGCLLVYILDKDDPVGLDKNNTLLRYIFLIIGVSLLYGALIFNVDIVATSVHTFATGNVTGLTTIANTTYTYGGAPTTLASIFSGGDAVYTVMWIIILFIIIIRMILDMIHITTHDFDVRGKK